MNSSATRAPRRLSRRTAVVGGGIGFAAALSGPALAPRRAQAAPLLAAAESTFTAEEQLALEAIVSSRLGGQMAPGAVVGVWIPERGSWVHAQGIGDLGTAAPIAVDDHFRIASVTKTFAATVVLQLIDEGKLTLDDTLERYVAGIPNGTEITIRQLLQMTAGIYDFTLDEQFLEVFRRDPRMRFTPDDVLKIVARHKPDFAPGTSLFYSDTNYILLGMIIEQLTGTTTTEALEQYIFTPLGLTRTSMPDTSRMPEPYAHGYTALSETDDVLLDITLVNAATAGTAGGIISTVADLGVWAVALGEGTLLSPETQRERLQWERIPGDSRLPVSYGLGIMDVAGFVGHNGAIYGYSTWLLFDPESKGALAVLVNRGELQTEYAAPIAVDIIKLLYPGRIAAAEGTAAASMPVA